MKLLIEHPKASATGVSLDRFTVGLDQPIMPGTISSQKLANTTFLAAPEYYIITLTSYSYINLIVILNEYIIELQPLLLLIAIGFAKRLGFFRHAVVLIQAVFSL